MGWVVEAIRALGDLPFPLLLAIAALVAFGESGLGVGTVFPGETAVLVLGTSATEPARFTLMLFVVGLGVTAGDHVGYWLGRRHGPRLREAKMVRKLGQRHWDRAMAALNQYGAAAVFVTRLVPVVRTLTPAVAGAARVPYRRFLPASLVGSLMWSALYVSLGAFAGASATRLEQLVGQAGWVLLGVLGVAVLIVAVLRGRRARQSEVKPELTRDQDLKIVE